MKETMHHGGDMTMCGEQASITLAAANALIASVLEAGAANGLAFAVAVVDVGGHLRAFGRADAAPFLTADMARDKAWTACSFGLSTRDWNSIVQAPQMAPIAGRPGLVAVGGGCPVRLQGQVIGGLGVSGGSHEQDHAMAMKALEQLGFEAG